MEDGKETFIEWLLSILGRLLINPFNKDDSMDYLIQNVSFYKIGTLFCKLKFSVVANIDWE